MTDAEFKAALAKVRAQVDRFTAEAKRLELGRADSQQFEFLENDINQWADTATAYLSADAPPEGIPQHQVMLWSPVRLSIQALQSRVSNDIASAYPPGVKPGPTYNKTVLEAWLEAAGKSFKESGVGGGIGLLGIGLVAAGLAVVFIVYGKK